MIGIGIGLAALVCVLMLAAIALPSKPKTQHSVAPQQHYPAPAPASVAAHEPAPVDMRSLRQRQIDEDAHVLSAEFARYEQERYRDEVRLRAARAFTPAASSAARPGVAGAANATA